MRLVLFLIDFLILFVIMFTLASVHVSGQNKGKKEEQLKNIKKGKK